MPAMPPIRVVMLSAECEPWAKTGGLADVVDALARALGRRPDEIAGQVDVFLPRYRASPSRRRRRARRSCASLTRGRARRAAARSRSSTSPADGYRLRLVDHPAAFDREGFYGDAAGDYADNAWRFGLFCRAALEALARRRLPVDVLHLHDWHTGPAAIWRDERYADDPIVGEAAMLITLHNLAYHGWTPRERVAQLGLRVGDGIVQDDGTGIDLLRVGIERSELANTVSPGFAAEALTPDFGMGLDGSLRAKGDRFIGILNGLDTAVWDPANGRRPRRALLPGRPGREGRLSRRSADARRVRCRRCRTRLRPHRPAGSPEGLRSHPRCGAGDAGPRRPADRAGERPCVSRGSVPRAGRRESPAGRLHRALRPRHGAPHLRGRRCLRHAVTVRAVRAGPDDRAALRDTPDRASDRRPGGYRRR